MFKVDKMNYELIDFVRTTITGDTVINLISITDNRRIAWYNSRPNIKEDIETLDLSKVFSADFGIADQCHITLQLRTSVLFRELVSCLRGTTMWAQTSRINPIDKLQVSTEYQDTASYENSQLKIKEAINELEAGTPQDLARLKVPVTISTCYFLEAPLRTWIILLKILKGFNTKIADHYFYHIWRVIKSALDSTDKDNKKLEFSDYKFDSKNLALSSMRVTKEEMAEPLSYVKSYGTSIVKFNSNVGMAAQFARHQHNQFRSSIWDYFLQPEDEHYKINLLSPITIITAMPESSYKTILSHRAEWLADFNLWSSFVESGTSELSDEEFSKVLDDPNNYLGDNLERIKLTDPNYPDPRILEMPELIDWRIKAEGHNYIIDRWKRLADLGYIKDNPNNKYRIQYLDNFNRILKK